MNLELWYEDMIRFQSDASEYGSYHQLLLQNMLPWLDPDMHICDAGSGLGHLALALAPHVRRVTAVELHPDAAGVLEGGCRRLGISNVRSLCGDVEQLPPEMPYDAMVFCFFGQPRQILRLARQQCRGQVFVFTRNYRNHRFSAGTHAAGRPGFPELCALLRELGIEARTETFRAEFGQPLRDWEDARRFFALYSRDPDRTAVAEVYLKQHVLETGREDFPLYLPHQKHMGFLTFPAQSIPDTFG